MSAVRYIVRWPNLCRWVSMTTSSCFLEASQAAPAAYQSELWQQDSGTIGWWYAFRGIWLWLLVHIFCFCWLLKSISPSYPYPHKSWHETTSQATAWNLAVRPPSAPGIGWCAAKTSGGRTLCGGLQGLEGWEAGKFNRQTEKTRRRMARERRGAGSSLVSMETPYYTTIY